MKRTNMAFLVLFIGIGCFFIFHSRFAMEPADPDEAPVPSAVSVSQNDIQTLPSDQNALGGYNLLIADRGNNRLIEVNPSKQIIWEYDFKLPRAGLGADDSFFSDGGKIVTVNLELYHLIEQINYQTKSVVWSYGKPGIAGSSPGLLNRPDDAYTLPDGNVISADIRNCRIIEISPSKQIIHQYGVTGICSDATGHLNFPNGDTPLPNGHILISNIGNHSIIELDQDWNQILDLKIPLSYPSDPQPTKDGNILVADYVNPGRIIEVDRSGNILWDYHVLSGSGKLDHPSIAIELPNGNILATDDFNHRVVVIDRQTKQITWQYGVTGKPGRNPGQLSVPDGLDIIMNNENQQLPQLSSPIYTVGEVTRHPQTFLGQTIQIKGYPLKILGAYVIFSDEKSGSLTVNDLPVVGQNVTKATSLHSYILKGTLVYGGLNSVNKNPYHFELVDFSEPK